MGRRTLSLAGLLLLSGSCALVYQTAWLREFRLVFGGSTAASGAVLAIFMGGLGVGNAWLGARADRTPNPLRMYAGLELWISATAALTPLLVVAARWVYVLSGGQSALGLGGATAARLLLSFAVLGVPTVLMGGTLPAASRAVTAHDDLNRRWLGLLYGANTLGAVAGVLLGAFFLLEALGTRWSLWLACLVNAGVAAAAYGLSQGAAVDGVAAGRSGAKAHASPRNSGRRQEAPPSRNQRVFVYAAAGIVGFAFFLMELVWLRMLGALLGGTTYTFGLILAVALAGIGLGGAAYPLVFRFLRPSLAWLAVTCVLEALAVALPYALGDRLAIQAAGLRAGSGASFQAVAWGWALVAAEVVLPAALVAGLQFPLLIALLGRSDEEVGRHVGRAFACNTAGAILGSLAGGFGLLPALTAPGAWRATALLLAVLGVAALVAALGEERGATQTHERRRLNWPAVAVACAGVPAAVACLSAVGPTAAWRYSQINAGQVKLPPSHNRTAVRDWVHFERRTTIWEAEGREASVAIRAADGLAFVVNGKADGSVAADAPTQVMLPLVGAILHESPRRGMVIGLGTGQSAGWLAEVAGMDRVDVVELEPALDEMARRCRATNFDVLAHRKVRRIYNDAREVLLTTPDRYDLIVSEPSNPYRAGVASLFTREFYEATRARLDEKGLFVQWLQAYSIDEATVGTVLKTLRTVFGHVEAWQTSTADMVLVCAAEPIVYDLGRIRQRLAEEPLRTALAKTWRVTDVEGFLAHHVAGPAVADSLAADATVPINTDDRNLVEYGFARAVGAATGYSVGRLRELDRKIGGGRTPWAGQGIDAASLGDQQFLIQIHTSDGPPQVPAGLDREARARAEAMLAFLRVDTRAAVTLWEGQSREPASMTEVAVMGLAYADRGSEKGRELAERLRRWQPVEADSIEAVYWIRQGRLDDAVKKMESVFRGLRRDPWFDPRIVEPVFGFAAIVAKQKPPHAPALYAAIEEPFAGRVFEERRLTAAVAIGGQIGAEATAAAVERFEPYVPWTGEILRTRLAAYKATEHPLAGRAREELEEFEAEGGRTKK